MTALICCTSYALSTYVTIALLFVGVVMSEVHRWHIVAGAAVLAMSLSACGGGANEAGAAQGTSASPSTATTTEQTDTPTPDGSPSASVGLSRDTSPESTAGANTSEPISEDVTSGPVPFEAVFRTTGTWDVDRFGIADRDDVRGWGVELFCHGQAAELELRMTHRFTKMTMQIGQSNDSPSSDQVVVVEIYKGTEQAEIRRIPFDTLTPFDISAEGVNAMTIQLYLDTEGENCSSSGSVVAVVEGLTLT